jgi:hypothetical protein
MPASLFRLGGETRNYTRVGKVLEEWQPQTRSHDATKVARACIGELREAELLAGARQHPDESSRGTSPVGTPRPVSDFDAICLQATG